MKKQLGKDSAAILELILMGMYLYEHFVNTFNICHFSSFLKCLYMCKDNMEGSQLRNEEVNNSNHNWQLG